jgi:Gluconate 2-dehydrogenase subunit 3
MRPDQAKADPYDLPRQRNGITPQMHGRYPDYDVLEQQDHWDEVTRGVVLERVHDIPEFRFFGAAEIDTLNAFADVVLAQDVEPRIPALAFVDQKLFSGGRDGYRYFDMPDDDEVWRIVARGLDEEARRRDVDRFALLGLDDQLEICHRFSKGELYGGSWGTLNVSRAWSLVMRYLTQAFYAHPWSWNEIGFGGPAYPRGYARIGAGQRESWEGAQAFERDPVKDTEERGDQEPARP